MIRHEWAKISHRGRPLWVSLDAYMVDGVRTIFTPDELRAMADQLGGRLITCREWDSRWMAAGLKNVPHPNAAWLTDRQGWRKHSAAVDRDLAAVEAQYGEPYRWVVGNTGKVHVFSQVDLARAKEAGIALDPRLVEEAAIDPQGDDPLYGWAYDRETKHLAAGIPLHAPATPGLAGKMWIIQRAIESSHRRHKDYSMTGVFARDTQPDRWWEIAPNGYPRVVNAPTVTVAKPEPDPEPLSARIAAWMLSHEGHAESPPGSNTSPLIDKWAEYCTRSINGVEQPIGKSLWTAFTGSDWCAVTYSAAISETRGELWPAFIGRVSVAELMADAKARGDFVPLDDVIKGKVEPVPGWAVLWPRFDPGTTRVTWRGHVDTWLGWGSRAEKTVDVIGGNVGNKVTRRVVPLVNGALSAHGFIRVPDSHLPNDKPPSVTAKTEPLRNDAVSLTERQAKGVDLSHHQAPRSLDWPRLSADFGFAIIRAAYGLSPDRYFVEHVRQARAHGMRVGAYTYVRQTQTADEQLATLVRQMEAAHFGPGDIVPALDLEDNAANGDGPADERLNEVAYEMATRLEKRFGARPLLYSERDIWKRLGSPAWWLTHPIWTSWPSIISDDPWPKGEWAIWQHHHGKGAKYPGRLDQNVAKWLPLIPED